MAGCKVDTSKLKHYTFSFAEHKGNDTSICI